MGKEQLVVQIRQAQHDIDKLSVAKIRLGSTSNAIQAGSFSDMPRLNPYLRENRERFTRIRLNLATAQTIKRVSIPRLSGRISNLEAFVAENWDNLPLRIHLRALRESQGKTYTDIGKAEGVRGSYISNIESGRRPPNERIIMTYAKALNLKPKTVENFVSRIDAERAERRINSRQERARLKPKEEKPDPTLGEALRRARIEAGLSMEDLAKETGIPYATIRQVESGYRKVPDELTVLKLSQIAVISISLDAFPSWFTHPANEGEYLRMKRVKAGIAKGKFAKMIGRHRSSIILTESGRRKPEEKTIKLYEDILGIKITFPDFKTK